MRVQVRVLGPDDKGVLVNVAPDVFDGPIDPVLTRESLNDPRHHIVVAIHDEVVVGFASAVHYVHPDKAPQLWINEVAVAPPHRRRGLAQAMLRLLFDVGQVGPPLTRPSVLRVGGPGSFVDRLVTRFGQCARRSM